MIQTSTQVRVLFIKCLVLFASLFLLGGNAALSQCTCSGTNLVQNPSFENGTTSWSWSGGTLSAGTGAVKCGSFSGDFQISNTASNWVSQRILTNPAIGTVINASVWAGTHDNTFWHQVVIDFFDVNDSWMGSSSVEVNKVLAAAPAGPQLYSWSGVVPAGCKYVNVGFSGNGNWIKTDQWCVTTAPATTVSLGDEVFVDLDGNGVKNGSDWGYDGATVKLYADNDDNGVADGAAIATQTTSGGGKYLFSGLAAGKYFVQIENVPSWMFVTPRNGGDPDNNIDNDNNGLSQSTVIKGGTITLSVGGEPGGLNHNGTYDFAIYKNNGLGDYVWVDNNANGIQDAGEPGLPNVTVQLKNASTGAVLATTTSDATGYYYFYDPAQYGTNNYTIVFTTPAGYSASPSNQGADDTKDSDPVGGIIANVNVPNGTWNYTFDAGFVPQLSLGNRVWYDGNNNGINDSENGIANVTVRLYADANNDNVADGAAIATTVTDANGYYTFSNLGAGNYIVGVVTPAGYISSSVNGGDPDNDINLDDNGQVTAGNETRGLAITLAAGTENNGTITTSNDNITYDFGFLPDCACTNSAGNLLVNGSFENGTTGWSWTGGTLTTGTGYIACGAANGFNNWSTGTSKVYQDVAVSAGATVTFTGFAGTHTPGITCSPKLSLIFMNASNTVLWQSDVNVTRDVDVNFGQLEQYSITVSAPAGTTKVRVQSSINCNTMKIDAFCLTSTSVLSLGDRVFYDKNDNGTRDADEVGIPNVTVKLYQDANNDNIADGAAIQTTTTDANGNYRFDGLSATNYIVGVMVPAGYRSSTLNNVDPDNNVDLDDNGNNTVTAGEVRGLAITLSPGTETLESGNYNNTYDFGFTGTGSIGDFVWGDANGNGLQDAGEAGIAGVTVRLVRAVGDTISTVTNASGGYLFSNLPPGNYTLIFPTLNGYNPSTPNVGANDAIDSDPVNGLVSVTLGAGENNLTIDAGYCPTSLTLGNFVWYDKNNNGAQDAGEPGISGATVNLYRDANGDNVPDGAPIATTTTNASGLYTFTNQLPGNYIVGVVIPAGYAAAATTGTSASPNNDNNTDNNGIVTVSGELRSSFITLVAGAEPTTDGDDSNGNLTLDFGLKGTASIGEFVWNDLNGNGIQDAGEPGIPNATVTLTYPDGSTISTTTDANGFYSFTNLAPGNYSVTFTTPAGTTPAPSNQGADDTKDSDPVGGVVSGIVLTAGQNNTTVDAGFQSVQLNLGNFVWYDKNNDGIQDASEPGINGAAVNLYRDANGDNVPDGAAIASTLTNASGIYGFSGLTPGNYIVGVVIPAGYAPAATTATSASPNNDNNTDNNGVTTVSGELRSNFITLTSGGEPTTDGDGNNGNLTMDFGLKGTGSIGDFVWNDLNGNGIQDAGEPGIPNATVTLTFPDGSTLSTTTDANGGYLFSNLPPGTYSVTFTTPAGTSPAPSNQGLDDTKDSDPVGGIVSGIVLTAGQNNTTVDAGFQSTQLNLGNFVWYDKNNNGIQDAGEPGVVGATVNLYRDANGDNAPDGAAIASTTTAAGGIYGFSGLTPGNYIVGVVIPAGYAPAATTATSASPNNDNNTDNNGVTTVSGELRSNFISLTTGGEPTTDGDGNNGNLTMDFGLKGTGSIGDFVWNDLNGNGIQDAGEPGIPNATVTLTFPDGSTLSTTTDANGGYLFSNLPPGTYSVTFTTPANTSPTASNQGADDTKDSDPVGGIVSGIVLTAGQNNLTVDAGFVSTGLNLGNFVWYDRNNNGLQDAGEPVINGATVNLYRDANGDNVPDGAAIATTTTNASGIYGFGGLTPGNYIVGVVIPAGYTAAITTATSASPNNDNNTDNNGVTTVSGELRSNFITLSTGGEPTTDGDGNNGNLTLDFGLKGTASIGDFVWNDTNGNGIQDAGEPGIPNATVTLTYPDGTTVSTTTDANGLYSFTNLAPGTYSVTFTTPAGLNPAPSNQGADDTKDSDPVGGVVSGIVLTAGQNNTTIDAGFRSCPSAPTAPGTAICTGTTTTLTATGAAGATFAWYTVPTGGTAVATGASFTTPVLTATTTYYVDQTVPGCATSPRTAVVVTVNPLPSSGINGPLTICALEPALFTATGAGVGATYSWTFGSGTPATATGSSATSTWNTPGEYPITLTVTLNGCTTVYNRTIVITQAVFALAGPDAEICQGGNITINGTGPAGATYSWTVVSGDPTSIDNGANSSNVLVSPLVTTVYRLTVTQNGCTRTDDVVVTINVNKNPTANAGPNVAVCMNNPVTIGGSPTGTPPVATPGAALGYTWSPATGLNDPTIPNPTVTLSTPGTYTYTVTVYVLATGCTATSSVQVTVQQCLNLGNFVWFDRNNNGIQDAGEPGINNATVKLYKDDNGDNIPDGAAIGTTNTNASGVYGFAGLNPGNYIVGVVLPTGYVASATTATSGSPNNDNNTDNNGITVVSGELRSNFITLSNGGEPITDGDGSNGNLTLDFGIRGTGSIGDFVWNDVNGDGIQDPGEPGIPGATVTLTYPDGSTLSITTDANGGYSFNNLPPGTYSVTFGTPAGTSPTAGNAGGDDTKDSDPVGGVVSGITLVPGQNNTTIDAGFVYPTGSIGNRVWNDLDKNGVQDPNEVGVSGITVSLYDGAGNLLATTVTDGLGNYLFTNLPVSLGGTNYQVRFSLPAEYVFSPQGQGGNSATDSDPNLTTGRTGNITLTPANKDRTDIDAGIYYAVQQRIGDFVWNDINKDGIQNTALVDGVSVPEPGIAGVTVTLYNSAGVPVRSTITDNNGYYQFSDVPVGTYTLGITPPVAYVVTVKDAGLDNLDNDFDPVTFRTAPFNVTVNTVNLTFDAGVYATPNTKAAVGDKVWYDYNNNGLQDAGEPGVQGVTVQLFSADPATYGTLLGTMTTDVFGNYIFNNLDSGIYFIKFTNLPAGYTVVPPAVGGVGNFQIDSDIDGTNGIGSTYTFLLVKDQTRLTVDAGIVKTVGNTSRLGDYVWYDNNKNGIQDATEVGVPGVTATLYDATTGAVLKTTSTNSAGFYQFTELGSGSYIVGFTNLPVGYVLTSKDAGANDAADSDGDPNSGRTGVYTISTPDTSIQTVDGGIYSSPNVRDGKGSIGDRVWNDVNGNGIQDPGEPGVPGVTVTLYAGDGTTVIATTTTDGLGNYIFTGLDAGNYVVGFSGLPAGFTIGTQNAGTDDTKDSDANPVTGKTAPVTLAPGEVNMTLDAGLVASAPKSNLGDVVWYDLNANGIQDAGEPGVPGVSVTLFNTSGAILKTAVTDATGKYLFTGLDAGNYIVGFSNLPAGYTPTVQNAAGSNAANNSDADVITGKTAAISLPLNATDLNWDLGIVSTSKAALGDYVWLDANNNGRQDAGEPGVSGVTVTLYDGSGNPVSSAVTDANGFYMFSNLSPGTYTVGFSNLPGNTQFTTKNAGGSTSANNSDVNTGTGLTDPIVLTGGQVRTDIDAGLISNFAAVGDYVWYDKNGNGRQDPGELPVPGVTVMLYNASGTLVASTVTDANGRYFINNIPVPAGGAQFYIDFNNNGDLPANTIEFTVKDVAGNAFDNIDSDAQPGIAGNPTSTAGGQTGLFTLQPGDVNLTIDAGIITQGGNVLPVTFTKLSGVYVDGVSKLSWSTMSEFNFSHFEVEHSTDGVNFKYVGNVKGTNTNHQVDYNFDHKQPVAGANYYRLRIVDRDGKYVYSNIVLLNVTIKGINITSVYPNPFTDRVNVTVVTEKAQQVRISMFDNAGKLVLSQVANVQRGTTVVPVDNLAKLAQGGYVIEVRAGDAVLTKQLVK